MVKRRSLFCLVFTILFLSFAGLFGWAIKLHRDYQSIPSEHFIGNKTSNVKALKEKGLPFSFLVMSDTHNSSTGEALLKAAMMKDDISFLIHVGDFVDGPGLWEHRFFLTNMSVEIKPSFPIFLVPGNHDIDYIPSGKKQKGQRVTPEIFESLYGARNFDFVFNNCLFILSEIDPRNPTNYLNYLRKTLSQKGVGRKYIFIFIHYPPERLVKYKDGAALPNEEEFFSLVESYKVTACFFGHYHGYRRAQTKGVNLIVLGGGGGRLKSWQSKWGKFHHLLKINVNENIITEDILALPEEMSNFYKTFKKWIFAHLFPIIENRVWILYIGLIFFLSWGLYSVIMVFRYREKHKKYEEC
jgi:Icc-related predicted phosphoesterase